MEAYTSLYLIVLASLLVAGGVVKYSYRLCKFMARVVGGRRS